MSDTRSAGVCESDLPVGEEQLPVARDVAIEKLAYRARLVRAMTENLPSPCVSVCRMAADSGLCEGCFRTIDEIRIWSSSDDATKKIMWNTLSERLRQAHPGAFDPAST